MPATRKAPRASMRAQSAGFKRQFALDVTLPLAEAAYAVAADKTPLLPPGYTLIGPIQIDKAKLTAMAETATLPQQRLLRSMAAESDVGGLVARHDKQKTLAISFRGTRTPEEWLKDFDFAQANYAAVPNWGKVHRGFQMVYSAMRASVTSLVTEAIDDCTDVWVIGHSLGGAVAVLCAPDVAKNMIDIVPQLHTYAAPRSGVQEFEKRFDALITTCDRIVNRWDLVWHLPPPLAGYRHVGREVEIDGGFTTNLSRAHNLEKSYRPGLERLSTIRPLVGLAA